MPSPASPPVRAGCCMNASPIAPRVVVAPFVAAKMTELMKAAVETGTGRAAQIGRPLAGKTGTTSSNKDGWFLGFTNELTTGVWMGRDDAKRRAWAGRRPCAGAGLCRLYGARRGRHSARTAGDQHRQSAR